MMRRLRIAVVSEAVPARGGAFAHAENMVEALSRWPDGGVDVMFLSLARVRGRGEVHAMEGVEVRQVQYGVFDRAFDLLASRSPVANSLFQMVRRLMGVPVGAALDAKLEALGVDLALFLEPSWHMARLSRVNYLATVLDVCHRDHPEFEEIRTNRTFEERERYHAAILPRATALLVDSQQLSEKLQRLYAIDPGRILVMPYKPAASLMRAATDEDQANADRREDQYILYPAQFWSHKNHAYILDALKLLADRGTNLNAIFCGGDMGNLQRVKARVRELGLAGRVHFPGFVPASELVGLYRGAFALVMPTYFGPTNIPPLEAMALACPVVVSDTQEFRAIYGEAVLYCDLEDPASLAANLEALEQNNIRAGLIARGRACINAVEDVDYCAGLGPALRSFARKVRTR